MTATIILRKKEIVVLAGEALDKTLEKMGLHPESYLATRQGVLISGDEVVKDVDVINLVPVISGGNL